MSVCKLYSFLLIVSYDFSVVSDICEFYTIKALKPYLILYGTSRHCFDFVDGKWIRGAISFC